MAIDFLPHRSFEQCNFAGTPAGWGQVRMEDWVLGFHEAGGAPLRFRLSDLIAELETSTDIDPDDVFWWTPLSTVKKAQDERLEPAKQTLATTFTSASISNIITSATGTVDAIRVNQNKDVAGVPGYILLFKTDYVSSSAPGKGASAISYGPVSPALGALYSGNSPLTGVAGPNVMTTWYPTTSAHTLYSTGVMVRAGFDKSRVIFAHDPAEFITPKETTFSGTIVNITDTDTTFMVVRQAVNNGTGGAVKHQPWVTNRKALHDTPTINGAGTSTWPIGEGGAYNMGKWWSSQGSGSSTTWNVLSSDQSGFTLSDAYTEGRAWSAYSYVNFRDHYNFLITAHWGLKNLKPCVIVWDSTMGKTETDFPSRRPLNWLYRGEALQPGDMYFFIF